MSLAAVTPVNPPVEPPVPSTLTKALVAVQAAIHSVGKDREVEVKSEKGRYAFKYATLSAIWDVIREPLAAAGLAVVQLPTVDLMKKLVSVETRLLHVSGESLVSLVDLPLVRSDPQGIGAIISYGRRYGIAAMLGVTQADEDEEAVLEAKHSGQPASQRPTPPSASKAKNDGPPVSEAEFEQQMKSCATPAELSKVASRIKGAVDDSARERLLIVYQSCLATLKGTGGA